MSPAGLGEENCKILWVHDSLFMVVLIFHGILWSLRGAHKASTVVAPAGEMSVDILT